MGKRTARIHSRNGRRRMHGGVDANGNRTWNEFMFGVDNTNASGNKNWTDWWQSLKSTTYNNSEKVSNAITDAGTNAVNTIEKTVTGNSTQQGEYDAFGNTGTSTPTGGRRRRRKRNMHGGDFSPNSAFTNAMEVHDIKMASPQTLVGGRRRRRKSSRRSRRSRRSRSSRHH